MRPRRVRNQQTRQTYKFRRHPVGGLDSTRVPLDPRSTSQVKSDPPPRGLSQPIREQGRPGLVTEDSQSLAAVVPTHALLMLQQSSIMQVAISASPCSSRPPGWAGEASPSMRLWVRQGESADQRAALVSTATVFILSRLVSHQILIRLPCCSGTKRSGASVPVHLLDKCEQNVNSFQLRPYPGGEGSSPAG